MKRGSLEWIDSMNRAADSMVEVMQSNYRKELEKQSAQTIETSTLVEPVDTEFNWYKSAQNYVVPAFFVVMLTLFIFGAMTLFDNRKAQKTKHKVKVLDFLDNEEQSK